MYEKLNKDNETNWIRILKMFPTIKSRPSMIIWYYNIYKLQDNNFIIDIKEKTIKQDILVVTKFCSFALVNPSKLIINNNKIFLLQNSNQWNYQKYQLKIARNYDNTTKDYDIYDMFNNVNLRNIMSIKVWVDAYACSTHSKQPNAS